MILGRETTSLNPSVNRVYVNMQDDRHLLKRAFRILKRNYGCPGNDRISIKDIKRNYIHYENIVWENLKEYNYNFEKQPKRTVIIDYLGNKRVIFVYNIIERWIQQFIKLQIESVIDASLSEHVYAYRRGKNYVDSYNYILKNNPNFILRTDIKNYFESINKEKLFILLKELGINNNLLRITKESLEHCTTGLPPGHVLSCLLSNLYLKDFDSNFPQYYVRYSDDMMFALKTRLGIYRTMWIVSKLLRVQRLRLNHKKTRIIHNPTFRKLL